LGITVAFNYVNKTIGGLDAELKVLVNDLLQRRDAPLSGIKDAGICHGGAGVAHIFQHLRNDGYNQIGAKDIEFWVENTLSLATYKEGYAGYMTFFPKEDSDVIWIKDIGLLTGITGIASAFLSILNNDLNWSKGLMIH